MTTPANDYRALYEKGITAARAGNYDDARRWLRAAAALDENRKQAWLALARLEKSPELKREIYQRVLKIDPKDAIAQAYFEGLKSANTSAAKSPPRLWMGIGALLLLLIGGGLIFALSQGSTPPPGTLPTLANHLAIEGDTRTTATELFTADALTAASLTPSPTPEITESTVGNFRPPLIGASPTAPTLATAARTSTATQAAPFSPNSGTTAPNIPPPLNTSAATQPPPRLITAAPTSQAQPTGIAPLFGTLDPQGDSTALPEFITPTEPYVDDINTAIPPTDAPAEVDPNAGGGRP